MDRKRTVRGNHQGILFWPRLTSASRHFGRNRDWEFNSSAHCNALTPCCSYTVIQRELKRGNAYKFRRLYRAKGENPQDHPVYICVWRLNTPRSVYCVRDDTSVQFNLTNGVIVLKNNKTSKKIYNHKYFYISYRLKRIKFRNV